jgi:hypothetical protein
VVAKSPHATLFFAYAQQQLIRDLKAMLVLVASTSTSPQLMIKPMKS